jgi:hypothetical protein
MKPIDDVRPDQIEVVVRELNDRFRAIQAAINALEGVGEQTPKRKGPLWMDGQDILEVRSLRVSSPTTIARIPIGQAIGSSVEGYTDVVESVDDIAEVVIPRIYKSLGAVEKQLNQVTDALARLGLVK